jgi:hypothetical protein
MSGRQGGEAFDVEASDQMGNCITRASAGVASGCLVIATISDSQNHDCPCDMNSGRDLRSTHLSESRTLGIRNWPKRVLLST